MKYNNITNDMKIILANEREQKRLIKYNKEKTLAGYVNYWKVLAILGLGVAIIEGFLIIELLKQATL
jgi:transglutaminase/protease-like cytokinesis protein 3